jgi:hypothetical protein
MLDLAVCLQFYCIQHNLLLNITLTQQRERERERESVCVCVDRYITKKNNGNQQH